jgi:hypothetical protein
MTDSGEFDARPVRAFLPGPDVRVDEIRVSAWPASVPALALGQSFRPVSWEDLSLVVAWRQFMRDPRAFFRHLI